VVEYLKSQGEPDYIEGILDGGRLGGRRVTALAAASGGARPTRCTTRPWKWC
jgi:hypothetical protein